MPAEEVCSMFYFVSSDLHFEISDLKYLVKLGGKTFLPARKALETLGQILENTSGALLEIPRCFV